jgi:hypothetical protein
MDLPVKKILTTSRKTILICQIYWSVFGDINNIYLPATIILGVADGCVVLELLED